ncbi:hypothetical protein CR513_24707, partial [Mucuna pruriens]
MTNKRTETILNFMVNSPKGTFFLRSIDASHVTKTIDKNFTMMNEIVVEVGEENVVQIVTDNATNYKETIVKAKRINTYIYARSGFNSLLHHFTKGCYLIRPAITHFATSYLCLGCLNDNKRALVSMEDMLHLADSDNKPTMGYIYEEIDRAKEKIQEAFNITYPCGKLLMRDGTINCIGLCLLQAIISIPFDYEVKKGLYDCLRRMVRTKKRNQLKPKTINDLGYVTTNSILGMKKVERRVRELNIEDSFVDDWIVEKDNKNSGVGVASHDPNKDVIHIEQ